MGPSLSVPELLIGMIEAFGAPRPSSFGYGELLEDLVQAIEDFAGGAPSGPAGGVLSGTYPDPGLANSVNLPGVPTAATASVATSDDQLATTEFVQEVFAATRLVLNPVAAVASYQSFAVVGGVPNGPSTAVDGYTPVTGDRVLVNAGGPAVLNGIWVVNTTGPWTRPLDYFTGMVFSAVATQCQGGIFRNNTIWSCTAAPGTVNTVDTTDVTWVNMAHSETSLVYLEDFIEPVTTVADILAGVPDPLFGLGVAKATLPTRTVVPPAGHSYTGNVGTIIAPSLDLYVGYTSGTFDTGPWTRVDLNGAQWWIADNWAAPSLLKSLHGGDIISDGVPNFSGGVPYPKCSGGFTNGTINGSYAVAPVAGQYGPAGYFIEGGEHYEIDLTIVGFGPAPVPLVIPITDTVNPINTSGSPVTYSVVIAAASQQPSGYEGQPSAVQQVTVNGVNQSISVTIPTWLSMRSPRGWFVHLAANTGGSPTAGTQNTAGPIVTAPMTTSPPAAGTYGQNPAFNRLFTVAGGVNVDPVADGTTFTIDSTFAYLGSHPNPSMSRAVGIHLTRTINWLERNQFHLYLIMCSIGVLIDTITNAYGRLDCVFTAGPGAIGIQHVGTSTYHSEVSMEGGFCADNLGNPGALIMAGDPVLAQPQCGQSTGKLSVRAESNGFYPGLQATTVGPGPSNTVSSVVYYGAGQALPVLTTDVWGSANTQPLVLGTGALVLQNNVALTSFAAVPTTGGGYALFEGTSPGPSTTLPTVVISGVTYSYMPMAQYRSGGSGMLAALGSFAYMLASAYAASPAPGNQNTTRPTDFFINTLVQSSLGECFLDDLEWLIEIAPFGGATGFKHIASQLVMQAGGTSTYTTPVGAPAVGTTPYASGNYPIRGAGTINGDSTLIGLGSGTGTGPWTTAVQDF